MTRDAILRSGDPGLVFAGGFGVTARTLQAGFRVQFVAEGERLGDRLGRLVLRERQMQEERDEHSDES